MWWNNECCGTRKTEEFETHPRLIERLFVPLICITKNTQVFDFFNGHFWPMPFPFLSNAPSLSLSLYMLIRLSLSLSPSTPHSVSPFVISNKYLLIWWDGIIVINWLKINVCFTWGMLTINSNDKEAPMLQLWLEKSLQVYLRMLAQSQLRINYYERFKTKYFNLTIICSTFISITTC